MQTCSCVEVATKISLSNLGFGISAQFSTSFRSLVNSKDKQESSNHKEKAFRENYHDSNL